MLVDKVQMLLGPQLEEDICFGQSGVPVVLSGDVSASAGSQYKYFTAFDLGPFEY